MKWYDLICRMRVTFQATMMINVKMPVSETYCLSDVLNNSLKQPETIPPSNWKEECKAKYFTQGDNGN